MPVHRRLSSVLALLVLLTASTAPAAITEKSAIQQAKAAAKTRLGLFKGALSAAQATVLARVDAADVAFESGPFTVLGVQSLVDDLADFQATVEDALFDLAVNTAADGNAALAALADGGGPLATLPLALASGVGGLPDQVRAATAKLLAKAYRAANKRLAKSGGLVARTGGATLFAVLDPPPQLFFAFSDQRGDSILFDLAIDLRVSASTTPSDGRLWVGGTTNRDGQDLVVSAIPMNTLATGEDKQVTSVGRGRFVARLGDAVTLPRNNYLLGVVPATLGATASSAFALR